MKGKEVSVHEDRDGRYIVLTMRTCMIPITDLPEDGLEHEVRCGAVECRDKVTRQSGE